MTPTNKNVLINREKYIGSSEISTIMGINKFKTRFNLLLEKAGLKEPEIVDNEYVNFGSEIEKHIRDYINKDYQDDLFVENTITKEQDIISLRTNYDGLNSDTALEIKSTSIIHENASEYVYYLVQLLYGMMLANVEKGILAVYKRNEDFKVEFEPNRLQIFTITLKQYKTLCEEINEAVEQFRIDLEKIKKNPFLTEQDLIDTSIVSVANIVVELEKKLQHYDELKKEYEEYKEKLKEQMEKNNLTGWEMPNGTLITLVAETPSKIVKEFNEDKFKEENELLYNKYLEDKEKKGRKGYVRITIKGEKNE